MVKRKSLIIYYSNEKAIKELDTNIVNIVYVSKKSNYAIIYLDEKKVYDVRKYLQRSKGIKEVIESKFNMDYYNF